MKIGFDIDGVLANWEQRAGPLLVKTSGRNLLPADFYAKRPPVWDWLRHYGYTPEELAAFWQALQTDATFWLNLPPMEGAKTLKLLWPALKRAHDVYFITNRSGAFVKRQTELWLLEHISDELRIKRGPDGGFPSHHPTVLISGDKGGCAKALALDCYVDDNVENVNAVAPYARTYLLDAPYNKEGVDLGVMRIHTLGQLFDVEVAAGRL